MSFAYLMESFPDPTKTFVYREVAAMAALGMEPVVFSVREPSAAEQGMMEGAGFDVRYLPAEAELRAMIERERGTFSARQRRALSRWRRGEDTTRVFEALWLGRELRRLRLRHVHAHFAGLAARTAWLVRDLWGMGFSFTGHADDIFSPEQMPVSLEMLVRDARFVVTETDYSRARLEREFEAARGRTFRVFNGIAPAELPEPQPAVPPRIVSVGRLVEKKGFPVLLEMCAALRARGLRFGCDIAGAGPLEAELRARVAEAGLGDCVVMHGALPQSAVRSLLQRARVFVLAAQHEGDGGSDNLPTVIMEAMAAGLPVVSTRVAGIPEMVTDGETGLLVEEKSAGALADAAGRFLADAEFALRCGAAGREVARRKFDIRNSARELALLLVCHGRVNAPARAAAAEPSLRLPLFARLRRLAGL